jgi:hypothetical protein
VGLRTDRWKYVRAPRPELYDLRDDPGETRNRAAEEPERVRELEARLREQLASERAPTAAAISDGDLGALRALGYALEPAAAPDATSRATGPDPKDGLALLGVLARAEQLAQRGDPAAGLALLRDRDHAPPAVLALRAALALRAGDTASAERDARALLAREPAREDARRMLADALRERAAAPGQ